MLVTKYIEENISDSTEKESVEEAVNAACEYLYSSGTDGYVKFEEYGDKSKVSFVNDDDLTVYVIIDAPIADVSSVITANNDERRPELAHNLTKTLADCFIHGKPHRNLKYFCLGAFLYDESENGKVVGRILLKKGRIDLRSSITNDKGFHDFLSVINEDSKDWSIHYGAH